MSIPSVLQKYLCVPNVPRQICFKNFLLISIFYKVFSKVSGKMAQNVKKPHNKAIFRESNLF